MTLGQRVKAIRNSLSDKPSQTEFADMLGLSRAQIKTYELDAVEMPEPTIRLVCREFGVSYDWLRTGAGEMFTAGTDDALDAILDPMLLHEKETAKAVIKALAKMGGEEWKMFRKFILDTAHEIEQSEHRQE